MPDINIGQLSEAINAKVDLDGNNATFPHIIDSYSNGTDWYRVWSDGFCEQAEYTANASQNVTLLVSYSNSDYTVLATVLTASPGTSYYSTKISNKTSTGFTMTGNSIGSMWYACGY